MRSRQKDDIKVLRTFVEMYCSDHHTGCECTPLPHGLGITRLCGNCADTVIYAINKRLNCPIEHEGGSCKGCRIVCYDSSKRSEIRRIMNYSSRKMIRRGRIDYVWKLLF